MGNIGVIVGEISPDAAMPMVGNKQRIAIIAILKPDLNDGQECLPFVNLPLLISDT